jgi:hypothetical protein
MNTEWQRALSVSHNKMSNVLLSQGDGPGALAAYQAGLAIGEDLAKRDPANTQWQVDVAVSCSKLGTMDQLLPVSIRSLSPARSGDSYCTETSRAITQQSRLHSLV